MVNFSYTHGESSAVSKLAANDSTDVIADIIKDYSIANYPNPFNPTTTISYQLPESGHVIIKVYDTIGNEVAELVNETRAEGRYTVQFNGSSLSSGIYFYTIKVNDYYATKKMLLMK